MITTEIRMQALHASFITSVEYVAKPHISEMVWEKLRMLGVVAGSSQ